MRLRLVLIALASTALYALLALRSDVASSERLFASWYQPERFEASVEFFGIWSVLFALYAVAVRMAARESKGLGVIFIGAIVFRAAIFLGSGFDADEPDVFLYGPSALSSAVAGFDVELLGKRIAAVLTDLGALALGPALLKAARLPIGAAVIHGWNPLVITEVAGSGRVEVMALFLLLLSLRLIHENARWAGSTTYGLSLGGPLVMVAALPVMARALRARVVLGLGLALSAWNASFSATPWLERVGWPPESYLGGSLTPALVGLASLLVTRDTLATTLAALTAWAAFVTMRAVRRPDGTTRPHESLVALGTLVLISPQVVPWAFVVMAYLGGFSANRGWIAFTATAPLTYLAMETGSWSFWLGFVQYFVPYALLIFFWLGRPPRAAAG